MLVSLDGEFVGAGVTSEKLRGTLLGMAGTTVRLGLSRGGEGEFSWDVVLTRFVCVPTKRWSFDGWLVNGRLIFVYHNAFRVSTLLPNKQSPTEKTALIFPV
jgi:hypothetical protein